MLDGLFAEWAKKGIHASVSKNGYLTYWTTGAAQDGNTLAEMAGHMINLSSSGMPEIRQSYHNFNPYRPDNTPEWYVFGGLANWGLASGALSLEKLSGQTRITTTGSSIKLYPANANGNVFVKNAFTKTTALSRIGSFAGKASFGIGITLDYIELRDGKISENKFYLNSIISMLGTWGGGYGATISTLYFGIDSFYPENQNGHSGWEGAMEDQSRLSQENNFNPYWQTWPGAMKL